MKTFYSVAALGMFVLIQVSTAQDALPKTIHVKADGSGDFVTIQEAIDAASEGDTIQIAAGAWHEPIEITKPLTILGEGQAETRIVSSAENPQPSREMLQVLQLLAAELDQETMVKVTEAFKKVYGSSVAVKVTEADSVILRNLSFQRSQPVRNGTHTHDPTLEFKDANVEMDGCAIIESPGLGLVISGKCEVRVKNCLVTNCWGTGIQVSVSEDSAVEIVDSDIRNNQYAGILIGSSSPRIAVRRCRIHGTGWHGIRYGGSPTIEQNVFHTTGVSGIYASGETKATVRNNLFYHSGISCWYNNQDLIQSNTFVGDFHSQEKAGISQGLKVLGASHPKVKKNIFVDCENAVALGKISGDSANAQTNGQVDLVQNVFWNNDLDYTDLGAHTTEPQELDLPEGNVVREPDFVDPGKRVFSLAEHSELRRDSIGAQDFAVWQSHWPAQPGEDRTITAVAERIQQVSASKR